MDQVCESYCGGAGNSSQNAGSTGRGIGAATRSIQKVRGAWKRNRQPRTRLVAKNAAESAMSLCWKSQGTGPSHSSTWIKGTQGDSYPVETHELEHNVNTALKLLGRRAMRRGQGVHR